MVSDGGQRRHVACTLCGLRGVTMERGVQACSTVLGREADFSLCGGCCWLAVALRSLSALLALDALVTAATALPRVPSPSIASQPTAIGNKQARWHHKEAHRTAQQEAEPAAERRENR